MESFIAGVALICDFTIVALNSFALVRTFWQAPA
jgi:hypothetical protein